MSERSRNLAAVFDALAASGPTTRGRLVAATGLSKATVARLVEQLLEQGLAEPVAAEPPAGRGRPSTSVRLPDALGHVVGVSLGLQGTGTLATDLGGAERSWSSERTPALASPEAAAAWLADRIEAAGEALGTPLLGVVVAVPARVLDDRDIAHAPLSFAPLTGTGLAEELGRRLAVPVVIESDATMALAGLELDGAVPASAGPVLLNMSTVLTIAMRRRDGSTARGRSDAFGDFSLLPYRDDRVESTLGALLSTRGLEAHAAGLGIGLSHVSELWTGVDPRLDGVRATFAEAVAAAVRVVAVMADPPVLVIAGRLAPLVELLCERIEGSLAATLATPPRLVVELEGTRGRSVPAGAALTARRTALRSISARLAAGEPTGALPG